MNNKEEIKETILSLFNKIDEDIKVEFSLSGDGLNVDLRMKEPQSLIGEKGQILLDVERLLKIITRKKAKEPFFINLDINNYKKKKIEYLKEIATEAADEVSLTGVEKKFPVMPAYERRIVHITLSERDDVVTESIYEGSEKRVIVKRV